jgi:rhomboid family GlyGly-CTERM serine protease
MRGLAAAEVGKVTRKTAWVTIAVALAALAPIVFPALKAFLIYDREAILAGEWWRMFTGHWVHLSTAHAGFDVAALSIAGMIIESQRRAVLARLVLISPWIISSALLFLEPHVNTYFGLSGIAMATVIWLGVDGALETGPWKWCCWGVLAAAMAKIVFEMLTGQAAFVEVNNPDVRVSVTSHVAGALVGLVMRFSSNGIGALLIFGARRGVCSSRNGP